MSETRATIRIIHFDDEVNTVSMIPNSLFNYFITRRAAWVPEDRCDYDRYVKSFEVVPPGERPVRIEYDLTDDVAECRRLIARFDLAKDIAVFDLMHQTDKGIEPIGMELYSETLKLGVDEDRIFILSGFPKMFEEAFPQFRIPEEQRFMKPTPSIEVVNRIVKLLPKYLQI